MGSNFVFLDKTGNQDLNSIEDAVLPIMKRWNLDYSSEYVSGCICMLCHMAGENPERSSNLQLFDEKDTRYVVLADARLDYKDELLDELELRNSLKEQHDTELIFRSYIKWGEKFTEHLYGDFSFCIWNESSNELFFCRDHFGTRPVYYIDEEEYIAISSDPATFTAITGFSLEMDDHTVLEIACSMFPPQSDSVLENVSRLEPASTLKVDASGHIAIRKYWDLKINPEYQHFSEDEAREGLKQRFMDAVSTRLPQQGLLGVELSGGLDSSSVAASICESGYQQSMIFAFSHGLPLNPDCKADSGHDETIHSRKLVEWCGIERHQIVRSKKDDGILMGIKDLIERRRIFDMQYFASLSDLLLQEVQRSGINVLFSGYGGDEGVTNSGYAIYEELIRKGKHREARRLLVQRIRRTGGSYMKKMLGLYARVYGYRFFLHKNRSRQKRQFYKFPLNPRLTRSFELISKYRSYWDKPYYPDVRLRQYNRLMHPHVTDRLESSYAAGLAKGIEYRYPFLDVKLLEFYYSLPSSYKYKDGIKRYLFREAMSGILPESIRLRDDKTGVSIPNIFSRIESDKGRLIELINEAQRENIFHYVDYLKLLEILDRLTKKTRSLSDEVYAPGFLSSISILILQKWQREGKLDSGIKI